MNDSQSFTASTSSVHGQSRTRLRRVSLPSPPPTHPPWTFRDEMGLAAMHTAAEPARMHRDKAVASSSSSPSTSLSSPPTQPPPPAKKQRKKWSAEETQMLVDGCNTWGVGNWKSILNDPQFKFKNRSPVDLKDRFRTYFPDAYRQHYPNAKTHLSTRVRSSLPDGSPIFEKIRNNKRRPFSAAEDEALASGFKKHGTAWSTIAKDPIFQSRRSTDLRDRFRNAFPDLYAQAGYKPRPVKGKKASVETSNTTSKAPSPPESVLSGSTLGVPPCKKPSLSTTSTDDSLSGTEDGGPFSEPSRAEDHSVNQMLDWKAEPSNLSLASLSSHQSPPESCSASSHTWEPSERHLWLPTSSPSTSSAFQAPFEGHQGTDRRNVIGNSAWGQQWFSAIPKLGWESRNRTSFTDLDTWSNPPETLSHDSHGDFSSDIGEASHLIHHANFQALHGSTHHHYAGDLISASALAVPSWLSMAHLEHPPRSHSRGYDGRRQSHLSACTSPTGIQLDTDFFTRSAHNLLLPPTLHLDMATADVQDQLLPDNGVSHSVTKDDLIRNSINNNYTLHSDQSTSHPSASHPQHYRSLSQPLLDFRTIPALHPTFRSQPQLDSEHALHDPFPVSFLHSSEPLSTAALDLQYRHPAPALQFGATTTELAASALDLASLPMSNTRLSNTFFSRPPVFAHPLPQQFASPAELLLKDDSTSRANFRV